MRELPRCPHCNVPRFDNPNADPALVAGMGHLCWKCCKPIDAEIEMSFPRWVNGQLVWACCVSSIGPVCNHMKEV